MHVEPHEAVQSSATGTLGTHPQSETNINIQSLHQTEYQTPKNPTVCLSARDIKIMSQPPARSSRGAPKINMREVLLGQGGALHLPLRARFPYILSVLAGAISSALLGAAFRAGIDWLGTDNIWVTSSVHVFFLPVVLPRMDQQSIVCCVMALTGISMYLGPTATAKGLLMGLAGYHGNLAHDEFDEYLIACASAGIAPTSGTTAKNALTDSMPFFRLGSSMGLGAASIIEPRAVLVTALAALTVSLCIAFIFYRRWHAEKEAEDAAGRTAVVARQTSYEVDTETEVSRARARTAGAVSDGGELEREQAAHASPGDISRQSHPTLSSVREDGEEEEEEEEEEEDDDDDDDDNTTATSKSAPSAAARAQRISRSNRSGGDKEKTS